MRMQKTICVLLAAMLLTASGCGRRTVSNSKSDSVYVPSSSAAESYEEIEVFCGESATFGNMTLTVDRVEDPGIKMDASGYSLIFFHATIENGSEETVPANYLNNFALTVDGSYFAPDKCFTIPAGKELYDYYGQNTFADEIEPGESYTGYLAAEVVPGFKELQLHYIPKTTDSGSRITVNLTKDDITSLTK